MAASGLRLLEDPALKARIVEAARVEVASRYCTSVVVPRYEAIYTAPIAQNGLLARNP
jgi:hypothetical protein